MHRKDFQAMADTIRVELRDSLNCIDDPDAQDVVRDALAQCAETFATIAAKSNPRFDRRRFFEACGVTP